MTGREGRPPLESTLQAAEFLRWYWLKQELQTFARHLGLSAAGSKEQLAERIRAHLADDPSLEPPPRRPPVARLVEPLSDSTVLPRGQRCSQPVRRWLEGQIGASFRFDAAMRTFFAENDGTRTLKDAVGHWYATRGRDPGAISPQFEYNRFTRTWYAEHPGATPAEVRRAWQDYRSRPVEDRGRA